MTPEQLKQKIAEIKAKHAKKPESFQDTVNRVKTKYGMMADDTSKLKKEDPVGGVGAAIGNFFSGASNPMAASINAAGAKAMGKSDLEKAKMDQDMTPGTKRIARDERRGSPKDPLQSQVTASPGVSKQGLSVRAKMIDSAKNQAKTTIQALKKDDESDGYKALRARMKAPNRLRPGNSDDKIRAALEGQKGTNPFASAGPGGGRDSSYAPSYTKRKEEPPKKELSAYEKLRARIKDGQKKKTANDVIDSAKEAVATKEEAPKYRNEAKWQKDNQNADEEKRPASARMLSRIRQARKEKKADLAARKDAVYKKAFGDDAHELYNSHEKLREQKTGLDWDEQQKHQQRIPGTNAKVTYHGQDEKGRHHFESEAGTHGRHSFAAIKNEKGKWDVQHIPKGPSDHNVQGRDNGSWYHRGSYAAQQPPMPWTDLDTAQAASEAKKQLSGYGSKGLKAAMTRVKQSGKFHEIVGKDKQTSLVHPKDFDKVMHRKNHWGDDSDASHELSVDQKAGGSNRFNYKFNPEHNAYVYHDYNESRRNPLPDKEVFEHIIKPSPAYQSKHKDNPTPPGVMSHTELEAKNQEKKKSAFKVIDSAKMGKSMPDDYCAPVTKCMSFLKKGKKLNKADMPMGDQPDPPAPVSGGY